jgi:hypothetical protein
MNEHQDQAREARLKLRGLLSVLYATDEQLRAAQLTTITGTSPPPITPERLSSLLAAVDDAADALDAERRRLHQGGLHHSPDLGTLPSEPTMTAAELRDYIQLHEQEARPHFLAECLRAIDITTEQAQAAALPGCSYDLLAFDVMTALRLLTLSHGDLSNGLKQAAAAHWQRHGPPPGVPRLPDAPGAGTATTEGVPGGTGLSVECDPGSLPPESPPNE